MKNISLLIFVFVIWCSAINAQNFTIQPNPAYAEADLDNPLTNPEVLQAIAEISNNTSDTLDLRWERIVEETPDGWKTAVCDPYICVYPNVDAREFTMYPNDTKDLWVEAWPGGQPCCLEINGAIPGEGEVHLKISNLNDPADTLIAVFLFTLTGSPILSLSALELETINVFPNPASDYFWLSESKDIDHLIVYDILGRQVKSFDVNGGRQFEINDLPIGCYLIGFFDQDQRNLKTVRLQKQ